MVIRERNVILQSQHGRPFLADVYYKANNTPKPVIIFSHGFKGFKDWGAFDLAADKFADAGFVYVKFNFSHNGTTVDHPMDFVDMEAFGNDNLSIELDDLGTVIDWVNSDEFPAKKEADLQRIYLCGHSRGGGISLLKTKEDTRIKKIVTWGSVNEFSKFWTKEELEKIKQDGVVFVGNSRTGQMMPIKWQLYENYFANMHRLFVPDVVRALQIPLLIIHGTKDETVPVDFAIEMKDWNNNAQLLLVENGNHNFGGRHPWNESALPKDLEFVVNETIKFLQQ